MRGGYVRCQEKDVLHVECKNYAKGLTTDVFKNVVHRIRNNTPLSLLFTSDIRGMFGKEGAWEAALNAVGWVDAPSCAMLPSAGSQQRGPLLVGVHEWRVEVDYETHK